MQKLQWHYHVKNAAGHCTIKKIKNTHARPN